MLFHYILLPLTITLAGAQPPPFLAPSQPTPRRPILSQLPVTTTTRPGRVPVALFYYLEPLTVPGEFTRGTHY